MSVPMERDLIARAAPVAVVVHQPVVDEDLGLQQGVELYQRRTGPVAHTSE